MRFHVLGPVEVWVQDRRYPIRTQKEQCVLAILLLDAGRTVSLPSLADRLWDDDPPSKARASIQAYVSRLRRRLREAGAGTDLITNSPGGGYRMNVPPDDIDARHFTRLVTQARAAAESDPERARSMLRQAADLWGGEPLTGLGSQWAEATRRELLERHRAATLARIELELRLGDNGNDLISELTGLTEAGRIDENAVGLLMRALYASGRTAEALAAFRSTDALLREGLGVGARPELRLLHQQILRGDIARPGLKDRAGPTGASLNTLDPDQRHLAGRDSELSELLTMVASDLRAGPGVALHALDGMPGIGKTALAVRAAHRLRQFCPDGLLQISLRTNHPHQRPVSPRDALAQLLEALTTSPRELERAGSSPDALAALWRRRSSGRRLLLLLDDVLDAEQIQPLLPTTPGSIVLLTSRRRLTGLPGLRQQTLGTLPDQAVHELLSDITGRVFQESDDLHRFIRRCAGLPQAITLAAVHLRNRPAWTLDDLNRRLDAASPLSPDDQLTAPIHAAFAVSFNALPERLRSLLCLIAAHPGTDISLHAAAALADTDPTTVDLDLDNLAEHHLVQQTGRHRYRLHDLLREYVLSQLTHRDQPEETAAALGRVLDYYLETAAHADRTLHPYRRPADETPSTPVLRHAALDTPAGARAWLDLEYPNLDAVNAEAQQRGWSRRAAFLTHVLAEHLDVRGDWHRAADILQNALDNGAAQVSAEIDDISARLLADLAAARIRTGELDLALSYAQTALNAWLASGDECGQADAYMQLGRIRWHARRPADAIAAYGQAAMLYGRIGDHSRRATTEDHLSITLFEAGHPNEAIAHGKRALATARSLDDAALRCDILINLGEIYRESGHYEQAMAHFREAETVIDSVRDPQNAAVLANNLGALHENIGDHETAQAHFHAALRQFRALGDLRNQIDTLVNLADTHTHLGDHDTALDHLRNATELAETVRDPLRHARIHQATGNVHMDRCHVPDAVESFRAALHQARIAKAPLDEARALLAIADALSLSDDPSASTYRQEAEAIHQRLKRADGVLGDETVL